MQEHIKQDAKIDLSKPLISLTFDDGPNTTTTIQVIDMLKKYNVNASFFLVGDNINNETEKSVKYALENNCTIENHSKTHTEMPKLSFDEIKAEIDFTTKKIIKITHDEPKFFRPPYIAVNDIMYDAVQLPFICGFGCEDWEESVTAKMRSDKIIANAKDGEIILLHDMEGNHATVEALDEIIPRLLEKGFQFVNIRQLFEYKKITPICKKGIIYTDILNN